jgi:hypothetical protein
VLVYAGDPDGESGTHVWKVIGGKAAVTVGPLRLARVNGAWIVWSP